MSTEKMTIHSVGTNGDGIADTANGPVFVPFGLPGEEVNVVRVKNQASIISFAQPSPDRIEAKCPHFGPEGLGGTCGGCSLQHWAGQPYGDFKRQLVINALKSRGLEVEILPLIAAGIGERRRLSLTGRATEKGVMLGFNQPESHHIVAISQCRVASPGIMARLVGVRRIAEALAGGSEPFKLSVLETLSGLDLAFDGTKKPTEARRQAIIDAVLAEKGIARVSLSGEILVAKANPQLDFGGVTVFPPPGTFVQATVAAEQAIADLVVTHMAGTKRVADLFSGCGTFALRLAPKHAVHAVEFDAPALAALDLAARNAQGLKPVTVERRDLFRRPLMAMDTKTIDGVVFDPPRSGAQTQASELASSKVAKIAAVSCNPMTLARDLRILVDGGYKIVSITPIDQFLWTSHVEAVALLER